MPLVTLCFAPPKSLFSTAIDLPLVLKRRETSSCNYRAHLAPFNRIQSIQLTFI